MLRMIVGSLILAESFLLVHQANAQLSPPSIEQCRTDAQLWLEESGWKTGFYYKLRQNLRTLTVRQMVERKQHMVECYSVDRESAESFLMVTDAYDLEIGERYGNFIVRHDLAGQFYKEDEGGLR